VPGERRFRGETADRRRLRRLLAVALSALLPAGFAAAETLSVAAAQQIQSLLAEKESRSPPQRKIDSKLLYAMRQRAGLDAAPGVPSLQTGVAVDAAGTTEVHLTAFVSDALLSRLRAQGVQILDVYASARSIRARVPLAVLETVAADPSVVFIQPKHQFIVWGEGGPEEVRFSKAPGKRAVITRGAAPTSAERASNVRSRLSAALAARPSSTDAVNVSEGDVTHRANLARSTFGVSGAGIKGRGALRRRERARDAPGFGRPAHRDDPPRPGRQRKRGRGDARDRARPRTRRTALFRDW
jgi:hypothetical protein